MAKKSKKKLQQEWDIGEEILCPACKNLKFDVQKVDAEKNRITLKCIACGTVFSKACNCQKSKMVAERVPPTPKKRTQNTRKRNTVAKKVSQVRAEEKKKIAKGEKIKKIGLRLPLRKYI